MKKLLWSMVFAFSFVFLSLSLAGAGPILDEILKKGELVVGITGDQPPLNAI